jgi:hypothetical protein
VRSAVYDSDVAPERASLQKLKLTHYQKFHGLNAPPRVWDPEKADPLGVPPGARVRADARPPYVYVAWRGDEGERGGCAGITGYCQRRPLWSAGAVLGLRVVGQFEFAPKAGRRNPSPVAALF